jgi:hypothetical protein
MSFVNAIVAENQKLGTQDWQLTRPATKREIEGYASATSVNRGESIDLYVNTASQNFTLEVFRMGWYGGIGARRVFGPINAPGTRQAMPIMDAETGLMDCAWINPYTLTTNATNWPSGVYLARLTASDNGMQSYIIFVVRDDQRSSGLLVQLSFTTYQAYNYWGGKSLYHWGSSDGKRAAKVSFNRPYAANSQNPAAAYGMGAGEFLTNLQPHPDTYKVSNAGWDYNVVRWLEREDYDVTYCTNVDTHCTENLLQRHAAWLSIGHDEYWSWEMREHVETARDTGVHLGFFTANCAYWQIRFEDSAASRTANRIMVCYKKASRDPIRKSGDPSRSTDKWRSEAVNRPEEKLIGVMYVGDPVDADIIVKAPEHWVFAGTGLKTGAKLSGLLGYEVDCIHGRAPGNLQILAESPWLAVNDASKHGLAHMSLYTATSGAIVFATGSMQWPWGLDDFNAPGLRTSRLSSEAQQTTCNILNRFLSPSD